MFSINNSILFKIIVPVKVRVVFLWIFFSMQNFLLMQMNVITIIFESSYP